MMGKAGLSCVIFLIVQLSLASSDVHDGLQLSGANGGQENVPENIFDFMATRGRRDNDLFWANRGKRSSSRLKPNGFIFVMGKKSDNPGAKKNALKPNGFNFLLNGKRSSMMRPHSFIIKGKRDGPNFNIPRPNGFIFPQLIGKRAKANSDEQPNFNNPRPTSFLWPSSYGKREENKLVWKNMIRPNGFLFSMAKGKKSDDLPLEMGNEEELEDVESVLESFDDPIHEDKREGLDMSFFAGRGKKSLSDISNEDMAFFAGRGKRPEEY